MAFGVVGMLGLIQFYCSDSGRILVFVNGTSSSVSVTGLTDESYSVSKGRTLLIVKWGSSYFPMNDKT